MAFFVIVIMCVSVVQLDDFIIGSFVICNQQS